MPDVDKMELYILKGLVTFRDYCSKFIEKIQPSDFSIETSPIIRVIKQYYAKYNKPPTVDVICDHGLPKIHKYDENKITASTDILIEAKLIPFEKENSYDFLVDETKKFIKRSAIERALMQSLPLVQEGKMDQAVAIINEANSITFDDSLGHDYFEDIEKRIERMKSGEDILPTGMDELDRNIGGGWHKKSLNIFGAGTNVGKTLVLSDITLKLISQGFNGLYISLEIYEDLLANRIDANLSDIALSELSDNPEYMMKVLLEIKNKNEEQGNPFGRLIIKEYAPGCLSANTLLSLVRDLQLKRNGFKPDFIVVDYIGLMIPNSSSFSDNTYGKLKTVAEELRSAGSILDVPVFSAVQVNRDAFRSKDIGLENTSDSMGIPMTADLMIMITRDDEENIMKWSVAKSRFSKNGTTIMVNVTYDKMRLMCRSDNEINIDADLVKKAKEIKSNIDKKSNEIKPRSSSAIKVSSNTNKSVII